MVLIAVAVIICAYLIGSINFAVIFSSIFIKKDVRKLGSGNAGATNMMREAGVLPGVLTFLCDALKGIAAAYLGYAAFKYAGANSGAAWAVPIYGAYACGIACMLGHVFPIFFKFKGGKGVATGAGIFAVCCPKSLIIGLCVFAVVLLVSRYVSISSLLATATVVILSFFLCDNQGNIVPKVIMGSIMLAIIFIKHSENLKRLARGEEKKMTFGRKKNG